MGGVEFELRLSYNFRTSLGTLSLDRVTLLNRVNAITSLHLSTSFEYCGDAEKGRCSDGVVSIWMFSR